MVSAIPDYITDYWGKAERTSGGELTWHPLAYHMLDVGAVAAALLDVRPQTLRRFSSLLGIFPDEARRLLPLVVTLHDLGKFAPAFQSKVPELWHNRGPVPAAHAHTQDGWLFWYGELCEDGGFSQIGILLVSTCRNAGRQAIDQDIHNNNVGTAGVLRK